MIEAPSFDQHMRQAQEAYSSREDLKAITEFLDASYLAIDQKPPDFLGASRAARGLVSVYDRKPFPAQGDIYMAYAEKLLGQAEAQITANEDQDLLFELQRERIQTSTVAGSRLLKRYLEEPDRETGETALIYLRSAWNKLDEVEAPGGPPDQYRINAVSRVAISEILIEGGDRIKGSEIARQAGKLAWHSESPDLPTGADLSPKYRIKALGRAVVRAKAARAVDILATPRASSLRIKAAHFIAKKII